MLRASLLVTAVVCRRITVRLLEDVEVPATVAAVRTTSSLTQNPRLTPSSRGIPFRQPLHESSREPSVASATAVRVQEQALGLKSGEFPGDSVAPQLTWLVLKDGNSYLVRDYWLEFGKLQCVTLDGERKLLPLARLDLDETVRLNRERGVQFAIRSRDSEP
jgi:hypothetical protein